MIRQYHPSRYRYTRLPNGRSLPCGAAPAGTLFRVPIRYAGEERFKLRKYIVEGWKPRRIAGYHRRLREGRIYHNDTFVANGSCLAVVRSLSNGKRTIMTDREVLRWVDGDVAHVPLSIIDKVPARKRHKCLVLRDAEGRCVDAAA